MSRVGYYVASGDDPARLADVVNQVIADGGVLEGGVAVLHRPNGYPTFYQAYTIDVAPEPTVEPSAIPCQECKPGWLCDKHKYSRHQTPPPATNTSRLV
jgi:hypothetical protein